MMELNMNRRDIISRLAGGERFVLDGATGSELQRRGVNVSKGITAEGGLGAWSATAMGEAPEVVREVHEDYFRVGADIVTTNSFWTDRIRLGMAGLSHKAEEYTRLAAKIACDARDRLNPEAFVAGSIAPPANEGLEEIFAEQSATLADAGVDIILFEYVGRVADCAAAVEAASSTGLPIFLGIRHVTLEGTMQYGEKLEDLASALRGRKVDAILTMCSQPEAISATLPGLRKAFDGPIGAYANIGYRRAPHAPSYPERQWHVIQNENYPPARYVQFAREWLDMGAQIIGGCCATTPEHIALLPPVVKGIS
jgi:S-methylmethionine-dependent homocysteine/selenocysteine methylase